MIVVVGHWKVCMKVAVVHLQVDKVSEAHFVVGMKVSEG